MTVNLSTSYLGLKLRTPLVPSASPLSEDVDLIKRMEDAGASAVVLHSLFEEQIRIERQELQYHLTHGTNSFSEAQNFLPPVEIFHTGTEQYLEHIRRAKETVKIPVIASLNGTTVGCWTDYAKKMEQAGADALELNIYYIPTDTETPAQVVEQTYIDILKQVKTSVKIPVAVKLSPFFSNMAWMAKQLDENGADGLVLFNRFYQPDINLENLEVMPNILLSTPQALRLPLRWVGILFGHVRANLAATGGIHEAADVLKMLMAGARVTMLCSTLLRNGIDHIKTIEKDLCDWMAEHEYESVRQMLGSMSQKECADPAAFERAQYIKAIATYPVPSAEKK